MNRPCKLQVVGSVKSGASTASSIERLMGFVKERRGKPLSGDFEGFERELHERMAEVERDLIGEELAKADIDQESLLIDGVLYRRVLRSAQTYQTAAGSVQVERTLYKDRTDPQMPAMSVVDARTGIVEGRWTPLAAKQATWMVSQMTPQLAEEAFRRLGSMQPSKSSLDRLPKALSARWESDRETFEETLRDSLEIPSDTATVVVSLDGVLAPMKDADAVGTRQRAADEGKLTKGPAGYREVGCATLSFCDAEGDMLAAIRMARMPEAHKVIAALANLGRKHPTSKRIATELEYFRNNRSRMRYAALAAQGIPIGSGVVEAACKTLVGQRLKCSGMRWGHDGGQAILTVRGWTQSDRFDEAWALLAATYEMQVTTLDNVLDIRRPTRSRASG
jgi:hypothetical protein